MSNRRKRAPPVRVDEEAKKRLEWNMLEDRKNEVILEEDLDQLPTCSSFIEQAQSSISLVSAEHIATVAEDLLSTSADTAPAPVSSVTVTAAEELPSTSTDTAPAPASSVTVTALAQTGLVWRALVGEFSVRPATPPSDSERRMFSLRRTDYWFSLSYSSIDDGSSVAQSKFEKETHRVDCSLSKISLDDLDWLQQRRVVQLCHQVKEDSYQVGIYLLEAGLGKPEFLSEGTTRLKKANQILQKLMEYFYDFIVPEVVESEEDDCDTELERQNIEELYDYVRRVHQREAANPSLDALREAADPSLDVQCEAANPSLDVQLEAANPILDFQCEAAEPSLDVQHKALIPVLRPYQRQAVSWMLRREKFRSTSPKEQGLHFLWNEVVTLCGKKLFYNPYTGCLIREFPLAGVEWPGGILADEMGLGKTVEVLALILCNPRQNLQQEAYTLPVGQSVNYFVPPPPEKRKPPPRKSEASQPKAKVNFPPVRSMLLMAIKESERGKGVSLHTMFSYMRGAYGYDGVKNRNHIKRTMKKLLDENKVKQVKGRGMMGSFKLGFNFSGTNEKLPTPSKTLPKTPETSPRKSIQRRAKDKAEVALQNALTEDDADLDLQLRDRPAPETKKEFDGSFSETLDDSTDTLDVSTSSRASQELDVSTSSQASQELDVSTSSRASQEQGVSTSSRAFQELDTLDTTDDIKEEEKSETMASDEPELPKRESIFPFNTSEYRFECICGELGIIDYKPRVQCMNCELWQHADCVNYKEESLETTPFFCPHCLVAMTPVPTGATLIISPSSICHQWVEEINKHIRSSSLRVLVYQGVKRHGFLQPHMLAEQDVVMTTYDVLRSELNYVDLPHSNSEDARRFRTQKRYMAVPSPLVAVEWWRICLDEAQMVECVTAKAAEMALRLASVNRWCVSGTPVQRGLEDLYGLVLFLRVDPFWVKRWWEQLLYRPYRRGNTAPLYSMISQILWRSAKKDVIDQIQIPAQTEEVHWLRFSPVEGHFYHRQHEVCSQDALLRLRKISDWSLKLGSLDRRTVHTILAPLLRLRQACCHPQAVRGEFLPLQKSTMTMEELLKSLQKKCRSECEEAHRQLVCALNGLAGIHIIRGEFVEAAEMYREVLRSSEEHKGKLKTDSLQRLHATHNLMELLNAQHPGIPPTLRDDRLSEEAEQLRQHYMTKYDSEVADAYNALQPVLQNIKELKRKVKLNSPWWLDIIQKAVRSSSEDELVTRVKNELTTNYKQPVNKLSMADKFRDASGLQFLLSTKLQELLKSQKTVQDAVKRLEGPASQEVIDEATVCHLRPNRLPLNNCVFCKADELFNDYESKLFSHTVKGQTAIFEEMIEEEEGLVDDRLPTTSRGLWAASETERALKAILAFAKYRRLDPELAEEGSTFMELFETWKKEYKVLHEYWGVLRNHVSAIDELGMATERLRVRLPDEPKPKLLHIIEPHEVEQNRVKLLNDQAMAKSQLQKKLGQQLYLNNLEKSQDKSTGGLNPEPCPICARPLGQEWAVLTCGHCFCNECIAIMVEQYSVGSRNRAIKCAICRQPTLHSDISYVFTAQASSSEQELPVKGSHSTKVEAVVRTLLKIQLTDSGAKCLVFSTWQSVLDIIAKALFDNNMEFTQINGNHKFQENLSSFKYDAQINILLLPLHTGSNGLNIIEATHVLLVEPILNPAHELQAIGRVHRIGQTKPTFVHRFLIKSTIEERMQTMMKTAEKSHSTTSMKHSEAAVLTVADLADLFTEDSAPWSEAPEDSGPLE